MSVAGVGRLCFRRRGGVSKVDGDVVDDRCAGVFWGCFSFVGDVVCNVDGVCAGVQSSGADLVNIHAVFTGSDVVYASSEGEWAAGFGYES